MAAESDELPEQACRELLLEMRDRATHNAGFTDDPALRKPALQFLDDYERIAALSGREFCDAVTAADERLRHETEAAFLLHREHFAVEMRDAIDDMYRASSALLDGLRDYYSEGRLAGEPSAKGRLFLQQAPVFLANCDRIRGLAGDEFVSQAEAAMTAFTSSADIKAIKAEIIASTPATPLLRRGYERLRDRLRP